ncbi:2-dehydro-3-deoxygluconokinase [Paracoccus isoporae]|uniref:2-dehydro-3-deoxygluconokinase n=1 Tax=Paracoccus isoporae TaxID=591205 RepID=A0A1G6WFQ1_9RHOB|nr:sugar kinase [Paracoccus isoporae]SDD64594.1 2-dehydro-3-deoxygluconokinase [Paracoccus isoporae]
MTGQKILSIGEAMVELSQAPPAGAGGAGDLWRLGFAGDTLNTAWYLRRLLAPDWEVAYLTRVGLGGFSDRLLEFIAAEGIDTAHIARDAWREVGLYAISLSEGERSFSYWRDFSAARWLADDPALLARALDGVGVAYLSGITLAILPEQGRANLLAALAAARRAGTRIVFDPNLRPRLWPDLDMMRAVVSEAAASCDLVMPSFDDEREFFVDADADGCVARYLDLGAAQVILKAGGDPVRFGGAEGAGVVGDLPRERPVDTTAAGDSFNAGYLAARLQGQGIETSIRQAHDLSRKVIGHPGALVREAVASHAAAD